MEAFPICSKERLGLLYREFSELQAELQKLDIDYQLASIEAPENRETKGLQDTYRQKCYKKRGKGTNATFCQELGGMIIAEEAKER
ncbi:hypothetical protein HZC30_02485 [Candidatus Woesearchaeota archaeon]|nr:hypothetical protein [Candidatus Woesearchaeota archaeon]